MSATPNKPKQPSQAGLMRSIGRFFGHIGHAVKAPAPSTEREEVSRETSETHSTDAQGRRVTLRRTTIDEIEIEDTSDEPRP
ncbi:MAG: hypothetical protein AAF995_10775 [Planctomycetota bacterium]